MLFIKRNGNLSKHAGEVSFPGGKFDKNNDKTLLQTAKREVFEEIGIKENCYTITKKLPEEHTVATNFIVSPFIAKTKAPLMFKINEREVEEIIMVPINHLKNKKFKIKVPLKINGKIFFNTFYYYKKHLIWGATSRILDNFLKQYD